MRYRCVLFALLVAVLSAGCATNRIERTVRAEEIAVDNGDAVVSASLHDGSVVSFSDEGGRYQWVDTPGGRVLCIVGMNDDEVRQSIPVSTIVEVQVRNDREPGSSTGIVVLSVVGGLMALLLVIAPGLGGH